MDPMPPIPPNPGGRPAPWVPPAKPVRRSDPIAVAVGNASLLGVGYVLLGRWPFVAVNWLVTVVLVGLLLTVERPWWVRILVLLVWVAAIAHGWLLATRQNRRAEGEAPAPVRQRLVAGGAAVAVLLALAGLRADAWRIENAADEAHRANRCEQSRKTLDGLWAGHRLVDPSLVNQEAPASREACAILLQAEREADRGELLPAAGTLASYREHPSALWNGARNRRADLLVEAAGEKLRTGLNGNIGDLTLGFEYLSLALAETPRKAPGVEKVLNGFLGSLPVEDPCTTAAITDWLSNRKPAGNELDQAFSVVPRVAPAALVGCGDQYLAGKSPEQARERYRQLLGEYPRHQLVSKARQGDRKATLAIQLANVRDLLGERDSDGVPLYCGQPAPYGGAKPYRGRGKGPYKTLVYGNDDNKRQLATSWLAKGPTDAVLVMCVGDLQQGSVVDTCDYYYADNPSQEFVAVYHRQKYPVTVYELRTGKAVARTSVQISGSSCPFSLFVAAGSEVVHEYVSPSKGQVRSAYKRLIDP